MVRFVLAILISVIGFAAPSFAGFCSIGLAPVTQQERTAYQVPSQVISWGTVNIAPAHLGGSMCGTVVYTGSRIILESSIDPANGKILGEFVEQHTTLEDGEIMVVGVEPGHSIDEIMNWVSNYMNRRGGKAKTYQVVAFSVDGKIGSIVQANKQDKPVE